MALHAVEKLRPEGDGGFTGCGKTLLGKRFVSGHDFSRAASI